MDQWYCMAGGNQYGPVDEGTVRTWLAERRLQPTDQVWKEGWDDWRPLSQLQKFGAVSATPAVAAPQVVYPPQLPTAPGAVASMVCGIISVVFAGMCGMGVILGIIALVQKAKAMNYIRTYPHQYGGKGFCTAGQVLGIIGTILGSLVLVYWVVWLSLVGVFFSAAASHGMHALP